MIGYRAQLWNGSVSAHVWCFVLRCAKCNDRISRYTRDALAAAACEAGWSPDDTGAEAFYCPRHTPADELDDIALA